MSGKLQQRRTKMNKLKINKLKTFCAEYFSLKYICWIELSWKMNPLTYTRILLISSITFVLFFYCFLSTLFNIKNLNYSHVVQMYIYESRIHKLVVISITDWFLLMLFKGCPGWMQWTKTSGLWGGQVAQE